MSACRIVVLVEDEPLLRGAMLTWLVDDGCVVHPATSHDEALEILRAIPATVLVTDIALVGERSGLDLARRVETEWPQVRIIITSGRLRPRGAEIPERALFCTKPCPPRVLTTLVRQCADW